MTTAHGRRGPGAQSPHTAQCVTCHAVVLPCQLLSTGKLTPPYILYNMLVCLPLCADGKMDSTRAMRIALDVLSGLADLHAAGIIMLDLKPDNVLLDIYDKAFLTDFGVSQVFEGTADRVVLENCAEVGTPAYM